MMSGRACFDYRSIIGRNKEHNAYCEVHRKEKLQRAATNDEFGI